ncbi:rodlin [Streptomyces hesseae]|uniref:Rodlin n=1 Tax=Streptomyces hesseae TaxID=3075519 RepID=A0ABU2SHQ1_9ACTN|nr:rodlin [Streptomyces sp. DSM 40473]MDT0448432.1 rodlin [Streptomyces sp. DSM 40473]
MLHKVLATVALTATAVGIAAAPAAALDRDVRTTLNGNGSETEHGATVTGGHESPQMTAVQGSLDKLCIGVGKLGLQSLLLLINVGIEDVPVLTSQQQQQCTDNSTIQDGDDPLSHLVNDIPVISGNGSGNEEEH